MKCLTTLTLTAVLAMAPSSGVLAAESTDSHPGVVRIDWSKHVGAQEPTVTVRVNPTLLRFVSSLATEVTSEAKELQGLTEIIGQLRLVRVQVFDDLDTGQPIAAILDTEADSLSGDGWETVVRAREGAEGVNVMLLPDGDWIRGIVVIAAGGDELAFVNVAGDFDPETLGQRLGVLLREASKGKLDLDDLLDFDQLGGAIEEVIEEAIEEGSHHRDHGVE